jgi:hypothetical protein
VVDGRGDRAGQPVSAGAQGGRDGYGMDGQRVGTWRCSWWTTIWVNLRTAVGRKAENCSRMPDLKRLTAHAAGRTTPTGTPAPGRRPRNVPRWPGPGAASGHPRSGTAPRTRAPGQAPTRARSRTAPGKATSQAAARPPIRLEHRFDLPGQAEINHPAAWSCGRKVFVSIRSCARCSRR